MGHHCFATKSTKSSCFCNAFDEIYIHKQHQKHKSEGFIEWNLHRRSEWLRGWHTVVVGSCCRLCTCMLWPFAECTVAWNLMLLWKMITCCIAKCGKPWTILLIYMHMALGWGLAFQRYLLVFQRSNQWSMCSTVQLCIAAATFVPSVTTSPRESKTSAGECSVGRTMIRFLPHISKVLPPGHLP